MTYSAVPALRVDPEIAAEWEPRLIAGALCGMAMTEKQGGSDVRANTTRAELGGRRLVGAHRPQVVLLVSALRHLPRARPGARGPLVLRRRARRGDGVPAPEGQARHPLAAVVGGRVPRRRGAAAGRGGPRRGDDHRDGHAHAAGLRDRQRVRDAPRRRRGRLARAPPLGLRRTAGRPARDGQRARRPRAGVRGRDRDRAAARPRLRRGRPRAAPLRHRDRQVLGLQARDAARGRGARVPRAATATSRSPRCRGCCATRR